MSDFSQKLIIFRQKNNLTQKELAKKIGVKENDIICWEKELNFPDAEEINLIEKFINKTFNENASNSVEKSNDDEENLINSYLNTEISSTNFNLNKTKPSYLNEFAGGNFGYAKPTGEDIESTIKVIEKHWDRIFIAIFLIIAVILSAISIINYSNSFKTDKINTSNYSKFMNVYMGYNINQSSIINPFMEYGVSIDNKNKNKNIAGTIEVEAYENNAFFQNFSITFFVMANKTEFYVLFPVGNKLGSYSYHIKVIFVEGEAKK